MSDESLGKRIGKSLLSSLIAGIFGVVVAEVVANSLVEISITPVFSIVCAELFFYLILFYRVRFLVLLLYYWLLH